ncbi:MAG: branched-chain amino acid ABC transporter permease [Clostridia bacterium]|nr:branched-chain amino acid ABC transporter permease [Clostridia bacterium]MBQ9506143.1 branched-chain amino acid ABC transporter permease [Clostridia bacterium]MBR5424847.1 branched-chain amino acid ABC transporter permease [Clostridia bacterium]
MSSLKKSKLSASAVRDYFSFPLVTAAFFIITFMSSHDMLNKRMQGLLVPVCCYIVMALSLNLTVGIMGELSLGHAGFMSLGAFTGVVVSQSLIDSVPNDILRLVIAIVAGALIAAVGGFLIGLPVLRLRGDYLAIVTLAFGEIIMDIVNCLIVGHDKNGLHIIFNFKGEKTVADLNLAENGTAIIKGAQGAVGTKTIATFTAGFLIIMLTLFLVLSFIRSRTGRAVLAIRDNRIAAESMGVNVMKYKMIAFVLSTTLAGMAGALYGLNFNMISADKFNFNTSILVLVFVVLGGLGNMLGSIIAATVLYILPEALRGLADYRMLMYAIVLILVMLATNNPKVRNLFVKILPKRKSKEGAQ